MVITDIKEYQREWVKTHKESMKVYQQEYNKKHPEHQCTEAHRALLRSYYRKNRIEILAKSQKKRDLVKANKLLDNKAVEEPLDEDKNSLFFMLKA